MTLFFVQYYLLIIVILQAVVLTQTRFDFREQPRPAAFPCGKDLKHTSFITILHLEGSKIIILPNILMIFTNFYLRLGIHIGMVNRQVIIRFLSHASR